MFLYADQKITKKEEVNILRKPVSLMLASQSNQSFPLKGPIILSVFPLCYLFFMIRH